MLTGPGVPSQQPLHAPWHQGSQYPADRGGAGQAGRLWSLESPVRHAGATQHLRWHSLLDGSGGLSNTLQKHYRQLILFRFELVYMEFSHKLILSCYCSHQLCLNKHILHLILISIFVCGCKSWFNVVKTTQKFTGIFHNKTPQLK